MRIDHQVIVFDAADLAAESSFWAGCSKVPWTPRMTGTW
jgi:hypothetical protein